MTSKPYYFQAEDGHGDVCGHQHRYFDQAVSCARSLERRARHQNRREEWRIELINRAAQQ